MIGNVHLVVGVSQINPPSLPRREFFARGEVRDETRELLCVIRVELHHTLEEITSRVRDIYPRATFFLRDAQHTR